MEFYGKSHCHMLWAPWHNTIDRNMSTIFFLKLKNTLNVWPSCTSPCSWSTIPPRCIAVTKAPTSFDLSDIIFPPTIFIPKPFPEKIQWMKHCQTAMTWTEYYRIFHEHVKSEVEEHTQHWWQNNMAEHTNITTVHRGNMAEHTNITANTPRIPDNLKLNEKTYPKVTTRWHCRELLIKFSV